MEACVSKLKLNILQVDSVYLLPLTPHKQEVCGVCHYAAHTHLTSQRFLCCQSVCMEGNNCFAQIKWESYVLKVQSSFILLQNTHMGLIIKKINLVLWPMLASPQESSFFFLLSSLQQQGRRFKSPHFLQKACMMSCVCVVLFRQLITINCL